MSDLGKQGTPIPATVVGPNVGGRPVDGDTAPDGCLCENGLLPVTPGNPRKAH